MARRFISMILCVTFLWTGVVPPAMAQELFLPPAGSVVSLSAPSSPLILRGMKVDAKDPLRMDFLVDKGRTAISEESFQDESLRLIRYFLAALTVPEKDLWVNLSPYESDRIIQDDFGRTGMGRDLLAQDYILKQLTAGLLHPDGETGKTFWAEIYKRSYDTYGTTDIPVDTFNKVWIVPSRSVVYESRSPDGKKISAFVQEMKLEVMLESDYLAASKIDPDVVGADLVSAHERADTRSAPTQELSKDVLRQVVIPILEKEVNEGSNFALLRQVSYSLILSVWLKKKLMSSVRTAVQSDPGSGNILSQIFINRHKTRGIEIADPQAQTELIYDKYVEAFKRGAYDLIKEEVDTYSQELIPRKYFSGGWSEGDAAEAMVIFDANELPAAYVDSLQLNEVTVDLAQITGEEDQPALVVDFDVLFESEKALPSKSETGIEDQPARVVDFDDFIEQPEVQVRNGFKRVEIRQYLERLSDLWKIAREHPLLKSSSGYSVDRRKFLWGFAVVGGAAVLGGGGFVVNMMMKNDADLAKPDIKPLVPLKFKPESLKGVLGTVGKNMTKFEKRRTDGYAAPRSWEEIFSKLSGLSPSEESVEKFSRLFQQGFDGICSGIAKAGLDAKDMLSQLMASAIIENTNLEVDKEQEKAPFGFGLFQFEADTFKNLVKSRVFNDFITSSERFETTDGRDLRKLLAELQERVEELTAEKGNKWKLNAVRKSPMKDPQVQLILTLLSWENKFSKLNAVEEAIYIQKSARVLKEHKLNFKSKEAALAQLDNYTDILEAWDREIKGGLSQKERVFLMLASAHKTGPKRGYYDFIDMEKSVLADKKLRGKKADRDFIMQQRRAKILWQRKKEDAWKNLDKFLQKSAVDSRSIKILKDPMRDDHAKVSDKVLDALKSKEDFRDRYEAYLFAAGRSRLESDRGPGNSKSKKYIIHARILRGVVDHAERASQITLVDKSSVGGIDLSGQDKAMDVLGDSGAFGLDLSPEQMKKMDQDLRGFMPLIIHVQPVKDVKMFLGFQETDAMSAGS